MVSTNALPFSMIPPSFWLQKPCTDAKCLSGPHVRRISIIGKKKILYVCGCTNDRNITVQLSYATAFMTETEMKHRIAIFQDKPIKENIQS